MSPSADRTRPKTLGTFSGDDPFNPVLAAIFAGLAAIGYGYLLTAARRRGAALADNADSAAA
jgi:hypothetical protein